MIGSLILILAVLCAVAGVVMIRRGVPRASAWTAAWVAVGLSLGVYRFIAPRSPHAQTLENAYEINRIAGRTLGEKLAPDTPGMRVLILVPPMGNGGEPGWPALPIIDGLRQGLGGDADTVDIRVPKRPGSVRARQHQPGQEGKTERIELASGLSWLDAKAFSALMDQYRGEFDLVVVYFINLPRVTGKPDWPRLAVLNAPVGHLRPMIAAGLIEAAVVLKPKPASAAQVKRVPSDPVEAFNLRYLLITPDNLRDIEHAWPKFLVGART